MTAFPDSGRSDPADFRKMNGSFRPFPDIRRIKKTPQKAGSSINAMMRMVAPQLHLYRGIEKILLRDWAKEINNATIGVCELLEKDLPGQTLQHISGGATRKGA